MKGTKRFCALLLTLCMLLSMAPVALAANSTIVMDTTSNKMTVNGSSVAIDADAAIKPQVKTINGKGYTMLPLRAVVEAVGGTVAYDTATKTITMTYSGNKLVHTIGTKTATLNGVAKTMEIASYAENNRTYVHLRAIELLSPNIKVNWNASAPTKISITYPQTTTTAPTKTVELTIKNAAVGYLQFTSLKLTPAGGSTFSANLLTSTLISGGTFTRTLSLVPGKYDLQGIDINGNTWNWYNLDFTNVKTTAYLTLTSGSLYTLALDSTLTGESTANVTVLNNTGAAIKAIDVYHSSSSAAYATNMYTGTLYTGSSAAFTLPYTASAPYYYIRATFANGNSLLYSYVNLGGANVRVTLRGDGTFIYGSTASGGDVYFVNKTGSSITDLRIALGASGSYSEDILDGTLKNNEYVELTGYTPEDLRGGRVYIKVANKDKQADYVSVTSSAKDSIVLTMDKSYNLTAKYDVHPEDKDYEEGLYIENDTGTDIEWLRVLIIDEVYEDFDSDDQEDAIDDWTSDKFFTDHVDVGGDSADYEADDYYIEIDDLEDNEYDLIDDWDVDDLANTELLFQVKFEGDNTKYYGDIDLDKSGWDYNAYITIESYDTADDTLELDDDYDFVEDDDDDDEDYESGLLFYNRTGYKVNVYVSTSKALTSSNYENDGSRVVKNLKNKEWGQADDYESYKNDVKGEKIYYYVKSESSTSSDSYGGSFEMKDSTKDNVCITLRGSSSSDERDYNWSKDGDNDSALYLFNSTEYDVKSLYIGIGSSETKAKNNQEEYDFSSFDDDELLEIDDIDVDDIEGYYIYVWADLDISGSDSSFKDDEFEYTIELYADDDDYFDDEDFEWVVLEMKSTNKLSAKYNKDLDYYE